MVGTALLLPAGGPAGNPATGRGWGAATVLPAMSDPSPPTPPTPPPPPIPPPPGAKPPGANPPGAGPGPGDDPDRSAERARLEADLAREFPRATPRRRLATGLVAFVVIAALVLSLVMVRRVSSGDEAGSGGDPSPTTQPEPATEAEIEQAVAEISDFVAGERGLDFVTPVQVELEGEGDFQDRLLADFDEDADQLRNTEVFLEGLGLVDPETDLVESMRSLLGVGVVGFYDPETDELVVRGAALTPYVRTTIAHELVHALDDQHLDLDRPEYDEADDEIGFGFSAVVEGNARRVENAYRASLSDEERDQATEEELSLGGTADLGDVPLVLVDLIGAPYALGEPLVADLASEGGEEAVNAAFGDPPRTSEQVLDPERYASREPAVEVPHPTVPGEVVEEGMLGELLVLLVLADGVDTEVARTAATGWGGDWGVAWRDGERSCVTANLVGDDASETTEMVVAFETWAEQHGDATVTEGPAPDAPFTVQACAG